MTVDMLIAQIRARAPEMPHHMAAAFLHDLLLKIQTEGAKDIRDLTNSSGNGYVFTIPADMVSISEIYADGILLSGSLTEADAMRIMHVQQTGGTIFGNYLEVTYNTQGDIGTLSDHNNEIIYI